MKKILIYKGEGVNVFCIASLIAALKCEEIDQTFHIMLANKDLFTTEDWQDNAHLVIFPGGRDTPYHNALKGSGNDKIRDFVLKGGNFLGICAGGYYGSSLIEFEKNGPLEVIAERELKFFPGIARGPAYGLGKFDYRSGKGAQIAKIDLLNSFTKTSAYYNGGCLFLEAEKYQTISILGRYSDIEGKPAAIVKCKVGQGQAILCGVHPEYSAFHECTGKNIKESLLLELKEIEKERRALFSSLMSELI